MAITLAWGELCRLVFVAVVRTWAGDFGLVFSSAMIALTVADTTGTSFDTESVAAERSSDTDPSTLGDTWLVMPFLVAPTIGLSHNTGAVG